MATKMILGSYTFALNPSSFTEIYEPTKTTAVVETYDSVAYFSWGTKIIGKILQFNWDYMTAEQYESMRAIYEADAQVVFDPAGITGLKFNVHVTKLTGKYYLGLAATNTFRKDVQMELVIMSEV